MKRTFALLLMLSSAPAWSAETVKYLALVVPAKGIADLDFDSKPVQDFIALLAKKQIARTAIGQRMPGA